MQANNEYIGDEKMQKMLEHYKCEIPLAVVKMRFAGAICSPNLSLRPSDVISSLWEKGQEPRLQTKDEADLFFKFFMGLWDKIFIEVKINKVVLPKLSKMTVAEKCIRRFAEVEMGFLEGFWGGEDNYKLPHYIAEILDNLSNLAEVYATLLKKAENGAEANSIEESIRNTDKLVNKAISFVIENQVLPNIEKAVRQVN